MRRLIPFEMSKFNTDPRVQIWMDKRKLLARPLLSKLGCQTRVGKRFVI